MVEGLFTFFLLFSKNSKVKYQYVELSYIFFPFSYFYLNGFRGYFYTEIKKIPNFNWIEIFKISLKKIRISKENFNFQYKFQNVQIKCSNFTRNYICLIVLFYSENVAHVFYYIFFMYNLNIFNWNSKI